MAIPANVCGFSAAPHTPLGISLYAPGEYSRIFAAGPYTSRHLVGGLLRELQLRSTGIGQREVSWLDWQLPQSILDSADVTEIMYFLGRCYSLGEVNSCRYSVRFDLEDFNEVRAALFKGLGFNSVEIRIEDCKTLNLPALLRSISIAADFHYQHVNLTLTRPLAGLVKTLKQLSARGSTLPHCVSLGRFPCSAENSRNFDTLFTGMTTLGYRVLGNDCFVSSDSALARAQRQRQLCLTNHGYNCQGVTDIIGLGPGNSSSWGSLHRQNPRQLPAYLTAQSPDRIPFGLPAHNFKPVLDQLLCYHNLDLTYFRRRYQWNLLPLIEQAWSQLQPPGRVLYSIRQGELRLTAAGVRSLAILCDALIEHLRAATGTLPGSASVAE